MLSVTALKNDALRILEPRVCVSHKTLQQTTPNQNRKMSLREKRICCLWRLLCFKPGLLTLIVHLFVMCCIRMSRAETQGHQELVVPVHYHPQNLSQPNRKSADARIACPLDCTCKAMEVNCKGAGWKSVASIGTLLRYQTVIQLDMSHNDISHLEEMAFAELRSIEELNLSGNRLTSIRPKVLDLPRLKTLRLDFNELSQLEVDSFTGSPWLRHLRLDHNLLGTIPVTTLTSHPRLETLNLSANRIRQIASKAFQVLSSLVTLVLDRNEIELIEDNAFQGLRALRLLELRHNQLGHIPILKHVPQLQELYMNHNQIHHLPSDLLQEAPNLTFIDLRNNPLHSIDHHAFAHLPRLVKLILSDVKSLTVFPHLNGTSSLELIRIDRSQLHHISADLCRFVPKLRSLELRSNKLTALPDLSECPELRLLDLSHNRIVSIPDNSFQRLHLLHDLLLGHNHIDSISMTALSGLHKLKTIDLVSNNIEWIHPEAFMPLIEIQDVNLGNNFFPGLPSVGLENVIHLKTFNNPNLQDFPSPGSFPKVQTLTLSYAYHCCPFVQSGTGGDLGVPSNGVYNPNPALQESVIFPWSQDIDLTAWAMGEGFWTQTKSSNGSQTIQDMNNMTNFLTDYAGLQGNLSQEELEALLSGAGPGVFVSTGIQKHTAQCLPKPGPFMPCQDLFDWWALRCGAWLVFLMALLGNGAVVFVLVFARSKIDVPRFLVCNLAMADFFMGLYLGFLAVVDASTLGEFRMYAIPWQLSTGCQVAGFLGVLSSELSVYTLAVITMERNYAITHAMHLNKRLSLRHAAYIMSIGWAFALVMAVLPLVGVSDYRKFAVCLPFEVEKSISLGYVVFLMVINGVSFLTLMGCYLKMYCAIRGSQAWNSNDSRIAKRMALLVFTDFLCWAPIAFFSLTAAFGLHLVSLEEAKVFTVFILPLNSCCNPFLYAILTKQFKKDCVMICKAIEESRVTRGIGRCRHSSNFSNRQTPVNTNSVGDRNSSRDGSSCQCSSRLLDKPNKRTKRWAIPTWHDLVARWTRREREGDLEASHDCAYQVGEMTPKRQPRKRRAESVSSDNFSSSRSGSVKAFSCGLPLRFTSSGRKGDSNKKSTRQRNTWIVTRKPSSDSNLSNSRNDSSTSALTASTSAGNSAWRTSRSSVSSDGGSSGVKLVGRRDSRDLQRALTSVSKAPKNGMLDLDSSEVPTRFGSFRDKTPRHVAARLHPTSPLAAGIIRQQSCAGTSGNVQRTVVPAATSIVMNANNALPAVTVDLVGPASRPKPRLTRQRAIHQDEYSQPSTSTGKTVSFDPLSRPDLHDHGAHGCPIHRQVKKLQGVFESSFDEYDKPYSDNSDDDGHVLEPNKRIKPKAHVSSNPNRLGLTGFIPRKLSTISSRSVSMNPDGGTEPEDGLGLPALHDQLATLIAAATPALTLFPNLLPPDQICYRQSAGTVTKIRKYRSENSLQPSGSTSPVASSELGKTSPEPNPMSRNRIVSKSDNTLALAEESGRTTGSSTKPQLEPLPLAISSSTPYLDKGNVMFLTSP